MDKTTQIVSDFEQVGTATVQVAIIMGSYYKDLLKNGIPADLAYLLTQEFNRQWWVMVLLKNPEGDKKGV